jgi:LuxR family maltose regulon positive regulatory protein
MSSPILATKLYTPRPRRNIVFRSHLTERLNEGIHRKLTLVSAPAGFGKTTLVSQWIVSCEQLTPSLRTAWLSLDEGDNHPTRFLIYLVTALQTIAPTVGEGLLAVLQSSPSESNEALLTALLNEISTISDDFLLVLDDYHVIDATPIDHALTFLLEYLPPQMHLVITTRDDPQLPLARLRARGQLTELRAADLRFTLAEAAQFLNQVMHLALSEAEIATLESRTEGWIAGLQLAALSMQSHHDVSEFIRAFAGDNRYIVDYLVEEVLRRQPESVRRFLLQTAILDRLNGSLCDAVTGQEDSKVRLEALERGNFFVVPLDDKRQWYRYHHLFADVLYAHLREEHTDQIAGLHRRASQWYQHRGSVADAIRHALAAEDYEHAAGLIERAVPEMFRMRQEAVLLGWMETLPDEFVRCRPVLSDQYAGALLSNGKFEGAEARLQDAEWWLDRITNGNMQEAAAVDGMMVDDDEAFRHLPGSIALHRAGQSLAQGNLPATMIYAQRVLDLAPENNYLLRGGAAAILGLASWTRGDLETAHRAYADGMADLNRAGYIADTIGGGIALADIRIAQGRLHDALHTYEQTLQRSSEQGSVLRGTADMHVGMSVIYRERNDLQAATEHLLKSKALGEHMGFPQHPYRWRVATARIHEVEGELERALELLQEAERVYVSDFAPNVRPIPAMRARIWIRQGQLDEAFDWARRHGLSVEDNPSYLHEFEHITLARLLIPRARSDRADDSLPTTLHHLLGRLLKAAEDGGRMGSVVEILILQALARQMQGDTVAALELLARALLLAQPEGYVRLFVDEGEPMASLLEKAVKQGHSPAYARILLSALGKEEGKTLPPSQGLAEPLSERELEVLRLFATDMNGPEIAHELVVSLSTLRTHTQNIYTKLGVNSRRTAVRRAEELNLL